LEAQKASEIAMEAMSRGHNCCEAILIAADRIWNLNLSFDTLAAGKLFKNGMGSGCTCGALVGLLMVSGILSQRYPHPQGKRLSSYLVTRFKEQFGSPCCREIRRQRTLSERIGNRGCKQLTGSTAALMVEVWGQA
jgi:C_GCAxxG_C_C family probable redox protein